MAMLGEIRFRSAGIRAFTEEEDPEEPEDEDESEEPLSSFEAFSEM